MSIFRCVGAHVGKELETLHICHLFVCLSVRLSVYLSLFSLPATSLSVLTHYIDKMTLKLDEPRQL